ncbi:hypothetical protein [Streptomyces sp. ODS28]|uniref:hypothetical protein n=1 Tax=Streptomyces sp. ODS28 TaxID=3136688 RepID=UPI0031E4EF5F
MYNPDGVHDCVAELRTVLAAHGITLPSLGADVLTLAGSPPKPLVELGCCRVDTARELIAVLRTAWHEEAQR